MRKTKILMRYYKRVFKKFDNFQKLLNEIEMSVFRAGLTELNYSNGFCIVGNYLPSNFTWCAGEYGKFNFKGRFWYRPDETFLYHGNFSHIFMRIFVYPTLSYASDLFATTKASKISPQAVWRHDLQPKRLLIFN